MSLTYSTMLPLGTPAPDFSLPDVTTGKTVSLKDMADRSALLIVFLCRHCPYVQHIAGQLKQLADDYLPRNLGIVAVSSNDIHAHPQDAPDSLKAFAREQGYAFPLLFDANQEVAKAYTAACTPDFFLFDKHFQLVYRGQLDSSRPGSGQPVTGQDLRQALDAVLSGKAVPKDQHPASGCNIKWLPGNEPAYFHPE